MIKTAMRILVTFIISQDWTPFHIKELDKFKNFKVNYEAVDSRARNLDSHQYNRSFLTHEVIGYLPYWEYDEYPDLNYNLLTQINFFSAELNQFGDVINDYKIRLHNKSWEAIVGLNTVTFTSYGTGNQIIKSYANKSVLESINIINPGTGYENKKRVTGTSGISTSLNTINISNHGYSSGERITYTSQETRVGGLTSGNDYYVTKVNEGPF